MSEPFIETEDVQLATYNLERKAATLTRSSFFATFANQLEAVTALGDWIHKSNLFSVQNSSQGALLAMGCLIRREDPISMCMGFDIIQGKLSKTPAQMLVELRQRGGKYRWLSDGKNGVATIEFEWLGEKNEFSFDTEDAKREGYIPAKQDSSWSKRPATMLRWRCVSNGMKMHVPEIGAGFYTPDEIESFDSPAIEIVETTSAKPPRKPRKPKPIPESELVEEIPSETTAKMPDGEPSMAEQQANGLATEDQLKIIHDLIEELDESQDAFDKQVVLGRGLESREQISRADALKFIMKLNDRITEVASGN